MFQEMIRQIQRAETISYTGKIENIVGMSIEASGGRAAVGDICQIYNGDAGGQVMAEVVGFKNDHILLMPYSDMSGISAGNFVRNTGRRLSLRMGPFLKGRVINALGQPIAGWTTTMLVLSAGLSGLFFILTIAVKYLNLLVRLTFKKQSYLIEGVEKLQK